MKELTCIVCPNGCRLEAEENVGVIEVRGALCGRGRDFAIAECTRPMRSLTTTVATVFHDMPRLPVKTKDEIPKDKLMAAMRMINRVLVDRPLKAGDTVLEDVFGTDIIAAADI